VVIIHGVQEWGVNGPLAGPLPFGHRIPADLGYGEDDAEFLVAHGFNGMRLSLSYWEHAPGLFDDGYLDGFRDFVRRLADAGVYSLIDMQQAIYGPRFAGGEGFPDWMTLTDGFPVVDAGYPNSYYVNPAMNRAWDNLWANTAASDGIGLQDHFAAGWKHLAERFAGESGVLGYDLINEPWPGTDWMACANPQGCPPGGFDETLLTPFYERVVEAIRTADREHPIVYEPNLLYDFGADTHVGRLDDPLAVFGFHIYCLSGAIPGFGDPGPCEVGEELSYDNAEAHSQRTGDGLLMGEWGGVSNLEGVERMTDSADSHLVSWLYWWYGRLVPDATKPPEAPNLDLEFLRRLVRPYPQLVAGTPTSIAYNRQTKRFEARYTTTLPNGQPAGSLVSRVFVPTLHYGSSYRLRVNGAVVTAGLGTQSVSLRACPGEKSVSVEVTNQQPAETLNCAEQAALEAARARPCLPRRLGVSGRGIGPVRLGAPLGGLSRRYRVNPLSKRPTQFCVRGGGRVVVRARRGRIASVATTARGHFTRQAAPGRGRARIRGARAVLPHLLVGQRRGRPGRVVYGLRNGKVRYLAVVRRQDVARVATLLRELRRLGLR
jgi:endoglycosylceramidase